MKKIGRYEIVEELGRGAMGVVYKASDPTIGRLVAIKVLALDTPVEVGVPGARDIFMREARAAGRLSHPGIVTIHDALEDPESRSSYIVMEFVPGRTLESVLLDKAALGTERGLEIIRQVADALDYAHRQQIIHRDLKPANILLTEDGRAKLTDFGIAKIVAREGALRTVAIMGTPAYMSPEQVTGGEIDARSDLFSLGIILYLILTGQKPFGGDTAAVMFKIVYEDPVLPSQLNPQLSSRHDYLALRCLAKDRNKRYASAHEFLDDLDDVRAGRPARSEAKFPMAELRAPERTMVTRKPLLAPPEARPAARQRPSWVSAWITAGVLLMVLVGVGIWLFRQGQKPPPAPSPTQATSASVPTPSTSAALVPETPPAAPSKEEAAPGISEKAVQAEGLPRPAPEAAAKAVGAPTAPAQPQPTGASAAGAPAGAVKPAVAPPPTSTPTASRLRVAKVVQLLWGHDLKEATLTIKSGTHVIYQGSLKGRKKRGVLGRKGEYEASVSRPITIPAGARALLVRLLSRDGSVDLAKTVRAVPPSTAVETLEAFVSRGQLTLNWKGTPPPKP